MSWLLPQCMNGWMMSWLLPQCMTGWMMSWLLPSVYEWVNDVMAPPISLWLGEWCHGSSHQCMNGWMMSWGGTGAAFRLHPVPEGVCVWGGSGVAWRKLAAPFPACPDTAGHVAPSAPPHTRCRGNVFIHIPSLFQCVLFLLYFRMTCNIKKELVCFWVQGPTTCSTPSRELYSPDSESHVNPPGSGREPRRPRRDQNPLTGRPWQPHVIIVHQEYMKRLDFILCLCLCVCVCVCVYIYV